MWGRLNNERILEYGHKTVGIRALDTVANMPFEPLHLGGMGDIYLRIAWNNRERYTWYGEVAREWNTVPVNVMQLWCWN